MEEKKIVLNTKCVVDVGKSITSQCIKNLFAGKGKPVKIAVVSDREVGGYYMKGFLEQFDAIGIKPAVITIDGSQAAKTIEAVKSVYERLMDIDFSEADTLIALGGGGVIDITAFAASTFGNGAKYILFPTTLLSMIESTLANCAMLNFQSQKDLIRVSVSPNHVVIDTAFLKTLPPRYMANGIAQVLQYGLTDNPSLLNRLSGPVDLAELVEESLLAGIRIRKNAPELLRFGRDIADAIEGHFRFLKYTQGEALGLGLIASDSSPALHTLYGRLGLPIELTGVTQETLMKRIMKSLEKQGDTVIIPRIGPEGKPVIQKVPYDAAERYYESLLTGICH